jgi:hypothetical protein
MSSISAIFVTIIILETNNNHVLNNVSSLQNFTLLACKRQLASTPNEHGSLLKSRCKEKFSRPDIIANVDI